MNREAIQQTIDRLLNRPPENFYMGSWADVLDGYTVDDLRVSSCGTTCCIAGDVYIAQLVGSGMSPLEATKQVILDLVDDLEKAAHIEKAALDALGLRPRDHHLFYMHEWPQYYIDLACDCTQLDVAVVLMIDMLSHEVRYDWGRDAYAWSQYAMPGLEP